MKGKKAVGEKRAARDRAAKLLLLAGSVVAALVIAEAGVRVLGFAPQINRINPDMKRTAYRISENPVLGYVFKENYRDRDNPDLKSSYPAINSHGFRDVERSYKKPAGTKRIILLGDSVVAGAVNIPDLDDTISRKLEKIFHEEGEKIEVLNMGINGYCTRAELEILKTKGLRYDPDLVILMFVPNDYHNMNSDLGFVTQPVAVQFLFARSHLFRYLAIRFNLFSVRTQLGVQEIAGEWAGTFLIKERDRAIDIIRSERETSASVKEHLVGIGDRNVHESIPALKQLSEEHGFGLAIGIWPLFDDAGIGEVESFNTVKMFVVEEVGELEIEKLALENGIPHFRFSRHYREHFRAGLKDGRFAGTNPKRLYVGDGILHVNPVGAQIAAERIRMYLQEQPKLLGADGNE